MPKFRYTGPETHAVVGISGARFKRGVINEVPDERLAGHLRTLETFEEVSQADVPEYPALVSLMPHQGDPHPDAMVSAAIRAAAGKGAPGNVGNLNREDQREANTASLAGKEQAVKDQAAEAPADAPEVQEQGTPETARRRK